MLLITLAFAPPPPNVNGCGSITSSTLYDLTCKGPAGCLSAPVPSTLPGVLYKSSTVSSELLVAGVSVCAADGNAQDNVTSTKPATARIWRKREIPRLC